MQNKKEVATMVMRSIRLFNEHKDNEQYWAGQIDALMWVLEKKPHNPPALPVPKEVEEIKKTMSKIIKENEK